MKNLIFYDKKNMETQNNDVSFTFSASKYSNSALWCRNFSGFPGPKIVQMVSVIGNGELASLLTFRM
jgi:hypothetical protein